MTGFSKPTKEALLDIDSVDDAVVQHSSGADHMAIAGGGRTPGNGPTKILAFRSDALRNLIRVLQKTLYAAFTENELPRVSEQVMLISNSVGRTPQVIHT
jgi:hypothetical protein